MDKERLVIVGNGMVSLRLLRKLVERDASRYRICVLGAEPVAAYNRILLSQVVSGEAEAGDLQLAERGWYRRHGIDLHTATPVTGIDRGRRVVVTPAAEFAYDRLVLAVGSEPIVLPVPGADLPGVFRFRDLRDTESILAAAQPQAHAVVIGGGLLGLEVASGLRARGSEVTVVHLMPTLMERQLDSAAGALLRRTLEARGMAFAMAARTEAILGAGHVSAVRLAGGTTLPAAMVVMAVGVRPNRTLARQAGLACQAGVLVDDGLTTSDPRIHALGECTEHRGRTYGFVAPLYEQADVLARRLTGEPGAAFEPDVSATTLKVSGVNVYSVGEFQDGCGDVIFLRDAGRGVYRRLSVNGGRLVGAVLCGEVQDGPWYSGLIRSRQDVTPFRDHVVFGQGHVSAWLATEGSHPAPPAAVQPSHAGLAAGARP